ncbi:MAG: GNAT family N-acetyltransferase [Fimbriimonadaceae bacterium]|nr:GNAT family N-acetyltransferase [Fimbriimonadaceae bacterium]
MPIIARRTDHAAIAALRELHRAEANCQIVHDSILRRGMADAYLIEIGGRLFGYGGIWNTIEPGMVMEFYVLPDRREASSEAFRALVEASGATRMEAQTNMPFMFETLREHGAHLVADRILFAEGRTTRHSRPEASFRRAGPAEFDASVSNAVQYVLETEDGVVAHGGYLCHYNPPYADVFMSVGEAFRGRGYGSFLVQELKRACYEAGKRPAARCNTDNPGSRRTLERAGFVVVGHLMVGDLTPGSGRRKP